MLTVSELFIYPIKSLGGISISIAKISDRGFDLDRRWMLVDENNRFLTQREVPSMALLQVELAPEGLIVYHKQNPGAIINIPVLPAAKEEVVVEIFEDNCTAIFVGKIADEWFSQMLSVRCRLVYMPDSTKRLVDKNYAHDSELTSFADGYPILIIGQSSLDDLNKRLEEPLPINRFRPNIVFTGGGPYEEDMMMHFTINSVNFFGVKLCARCTIPNVNQNDASKSAEPLRTLASYRQKNNKVYFGQNLLHRGTGSIHVGDTIEIIERAPSENLMLG
jgi:uncharacterized protein YcbX